METILSNIDTFIATHPAIFFTAYGVTLLLLLILFVFIRRTTTSEDHDTSLSSHLKQLVHYYRFGEVSTHLNDELPMSPTDREKYRYLKRRNGIMTLFSTISFLGISFSTLHFLLGNLHLWPFLVYFILTVVYFFISFIVNVFSRDFNIKKHNRIVAKWKSFLTARVDIFLPTAGEPLEVLRNTWDGILEMEEKFQGRISVYCLDDSARAEVETLAKDYGFEYIVRPKRGWFKKAGNLRYGYKISNGEFIAIFDADFRPRSDFLSEMLPYFYEYKDVGIVQSPQYFDVLLTQNWLQRGAGAVQELFYRVSQVSRQAHNASICVGTNAVYRREALAETGGTALIQHSEDVHTGFTMRTRGWTIQYIPVILAKGLCPQDMQAFFKQQYRWCLGSMTLLNSGKFWKMKMSPISRFSYFSGFLYYIHTAISSFIIPLIPIIILLYFPHQVTWKNYLYLLPSLIFVQLIYPFWHTVIYGVEAWSTRLIYGWAHLFAVTDAITKNAMSWQPTGGKIRTDLRYRTFRVLQIIFNLIPAVLWVGLACEKVFWDKNPLFIPLLISGLYYYFVSIKVSLFFSEQKSVSSFTRVMRSLFVRPSMSFIIILLSVTLLITARETSRPYFTNSMVNAAMIGKAQPTQTTIPLHQTLSPSPIMNEKLLTSWSYYKEHFMTEEGQSLDPDRDYETTSEGQSYLMLRSVIMNDQETFATVWNWTKLHLQHDDDALFSWLYGNRDGKDEVIDPHNATDADEDIALALIMAGYRFGEVSYLREAQQIIASLWEHNVVEIKGRYYLLAGSHFAKPDGYVINPSYFSPASYRVFSVIDEEHPWTKLADDSYFILNALATESHNATGLIPNWVLVSKTGTFSNPTEYIETDTNVYGYDAFRTYFRITLDSKWFATQNARQLAGLVEPFFTKTWDKDHLFKAEYSLAGNPTVQYSSISTDTGALSIFMLRDTDLATEVYQHLFAKKYNANGYWGNGENYYDQNWAWFATALFTDNFTLPEAD